MSNVSVANEIYYTFILCFLFLVLSLKYATSEPQLFLLYVNEYYYVHLPLYYNLFPLFEVCATQAYVCIIGFLCIILTNPNILPLGLVHWYNFIIMWRRLAVQNRILVQRNDKWSYHKTYGFF